MLESIEKIRLETLRISIRYDLSINELVKAANFNGCVDSDVTDEHFPEESRLEEKDKEATLVHIVGAHAIIEDVNVAVKHFHLRHGTVKELLSLAINDPDKLRFSSITELGSLWLNPRYDHMPLVAYLNNQAPKSEWSYDQDSPASRWHWDGWRGLGLNPCWHHYDVYVRDCFLAFRES